jgi:large subunit ribosomal protein L28
MAKLPLLLTNAGCKASFKQPALNDLKKLHQSASYGIVSGYSHQGWLFLSLNYGGPPMAVCQMTGKKRSFGHNVSHAKNRTNRSWKPNIQWAMVEVNGQMKRMKVSTRYIRTMYKDR